MGNKKTLPLEALDEIVEDWDISPNALDVRIIKNGLEALEIIKSKRVDIDLFFTVMGDINQKDKLRAYNFWNVKSRKLTKEEFDSLKEVLI